MKESTVRDLVDYLTEQTGQTTGISKCILLMNRAAMLYLRESWARGKECGELESRQIDRDEGLVYSGWSKTVQSEPSGRIELTQVDEELYFLTESAELLVEMGLQHIEPGKGYLFRPMNSSRNAFMDEPLKAAAMRKRVQQHMMKAELYEGETLHSFQRSAVQHAAEMGRYSVEKLMKRGRWASYAAFKLYIEEIQHKFGRWQLI
jgi:hypothetical protein